MDSEMYQWHMGVTHDYAQAEEKVLSSTEGIDNIWAVMTSKVMHRNPKGKHWAEPRSQWRFLKKQNNQTGEQWMQVLLAEMNLREQLI